MSVEILLPVHQIKFCAMHQTERFSAWESDVYSLLDGLAHAEVSIAKLRFRCGCYATLFETP